MLNKINGQNSCQILTAEVGDTPQSTLEVRMGKAYERAAL